MSASWLVTSDQAFHAVGAKIALSVPPPALLNVDLSVAHIAEAQSPLHCQVLLAESRGATHTNLDPLRLFLANETPLVSILWNLLSAGG